VIIATHYAANDLAPGSLDRCATLCFEAAHTRIDNLRVRTNRLRDLCKGRGDLAGSRARVFDDANCDRQNGNSHLTLASLERARPAFGFSRHFLASVLMNRQACGLRFADAWSFCSR
jgi:hypothetical protein